KEKGEKLARSVPERASPRRLDSLDDDPVLGRIVTEREVQVFVAAGDSGLKQDLIGHLGIVAGDQLAAGQLVAAGAVFLQQGWAVALLAVVTPVLHNARALEDHRGVAIIAESQRFRAGQGGENDHAEERRRAQ